MRARIKNATGSFPSTWRPEPDDILEGPLVRYERFAGNGKIESCDVAIIHNAETDEDVSVFLRPVVLRRVFAVWCPVPTEYVCLRYIGEAPDGKTKLFELGVDRELSSSAAYLPTFDAPPHTDDDGPDVTDDESTPF